MNTFIIQDNFLQEDYILLENVNILITDITDSGTTRKFWPSLKVVDTEFLARDARELRNYIKEIQPSVDLSYDYEDARGNITTIDIPVGVNFFWPDATI